MIGGGKLETKIKEVSFRKKEYIDRVNKMIRGLPNVDARVINTLLGIGVGYASHQRHLKLIILANQIYELAGNNKNNHGHAFEALYCWNHNAKPRNIWSSRKAKVVLNRAAPQVDVVVVSSNKVVERIQAKNTPDSPNATARQIRKGKYTKARIVGTTETSNKVNNHLRKSDYNGSQSVEDSGISILEAKKYARSAKSSIHKQIEHQKINIGLSVIPATTGASKRGFKDYVHVSSGRISKREYTERVLKDGAVHFGGAYMSTLSVQASVKAMTIILSKIGFIGGPVTGMITGIGSAYIGSVINDYICQKYGLSDIEEHLSYYIMIKEKEIIKSTLKCRNRNNSYKDNRFRINSNKSRKKCLLG